MNAQVPAQVPVIPTHKLGIAMVHMAEQGKRPCFRLNGIRITIAAATSVNPGYLYIKDSNWDYIGKISPSGKLSIAHPSKITEKQEMLVLAAIADPESTAMSTGRATGKCCCCGRTLTNKLSIDLGIGPICRGFWFPSNNQLILDSLDSSSDLLIQEKLDLDIDLDINLDTLDDEYAVKILVARYQKLTPQQKDMFVLECLGNTTKGADF